MQSDEHDLNDQRAGKTPFWELLYEDPDAEPFGPPSPEIVEMATTLPHGAVVLDLGCGDGRNTLCLAEHGLLVDAFDVSMAGVRKVRSRARAAGVPVHAWVQDIATFSFRREYDLVVAHGVLHMLPRDAWHRALDSLQRHTRPGGWNIVVVFTDRLPPPDDLAPYMRGLFREEELLDRYRDWSVDRWEAYTLHDQHPGGVRHRHPVNKIVARKPER
ncbi:MAG: methyltransferase domain-containing protein [Gemmatimonadota bacterium]|jgi:tellurite methyltransferase